MVELKLPGGGGATVSMVLNGKKVTPSAFRIHGASGSTPPVDPPTTHTIVGIYNGSSNGADDLFFNALGGLGGALGAGTSYHTSNADQYNAGVRPARPLASWDLTRIARGYRTFIHFQSRSYSVSAGHHVVTHSWKDVANGVHDSDFTAWGNGLKNAPVGTSFTFDGEPETTLEPGTTLSQNGNPDYTPEYYAEAQRRVYGIIKGIAPQIDFRFWMAGHDLNTSYMTRFYPGNAYVDSIAIDPYVWGHNAASTTPIQKWQPIVNWVRARGWDRPIGIGETGIDCNVHGDAAGAAFWQKVPAAAQTLDLKWITFFNRFNWQISPSTFPQTWASYIAAMTEMAA